MAWDAGVLKVGVVGSPGGLKVHGSSAWCRADGMRGERLEALVWCFLC